MKNWNLARLATLAEIGASIGVMISVVYLAIQIQGGNEQLRAQSTTTPSTSCTNRSS